jgi:hypothetical protein
LEAVSTGYVDLGQPVSNSGIVGVLSPDPLDITTTAADNPLDIIGQSGTAWESDGYHEQPERYMIRKHRRELVIIFHIF